jgi:hypothetical protein
MPDFAAPQPNYFSRMIERSERFGWFAITGIFLLIAWSILRLWMAD